MAASDPPSAQRTASGRLPSQGHLMSRSFSRLQVGIPMRSGQRASPALIGDPARSVLGPARALLQAMGTNEPQKDVQKLRTTVRQLLKMDKEQQNDDAAIAEDEEELPPAASPFAFRGARALSRLTPARLAETKGSERNYRDSMRASTPARTSEEHGSSPHTQSYIIQANN
ncbi:Uu.00g146380.m01.CDS01 [Anthostomella pinea]|uniref:Uu.00g146380.m01.CDS01 n=1 Tax=Anthostomella pinea TaxID=933095 RepID=A0AAI8VSE2_9PEZI|nr:Uu.00g146380.m01.CDS01 [Anthostomella pinea]